MEYLKLLELIIGIVVGSLTILTVMSKMLNKFVQSFINPLNENMKMLSDSINRLSDKVEEISRQQQTEAIEMARMKEQIKIFRGNNQ